MMLLLLLQALYSIIDDCEPLSHQVIGATYLLMADKPKNKVAGDNSKTRFYTTRLPLIKVPVELDHCSVPMEVDTGASVSIMVETLYH